MGNLNKYFSIQCDRHLLQNNVNISTVHSHFKTVQSFKTDILPNSTHKTSVILRQPILQQSPIKPVESYIVNMLPDIVHNPGHSLIRIIRPQCVHQIFQKLALSAFDNPKEGAQFSASSPVLRVHAVHCHHQFRHFLFQFQCRCKQSVYILQAPFCLHHHHNYTITRCRDEQSRNIDRR